VSALAVSEVRTHAILARFQGYPLKAIISLFAMFCKSMPGKVAQLACLVY
jgi:hypothetical protein